MKSLSPSALQKLAKENPFQRVALRFHRTEESKEFIFDEQDVIAEAGQAEKIIELFEKHSNLYVSLVLTSNT